MFEYKCDSGNLSNWNLWQRQGVGLAGSIVYLGLQFFHHFFKLKQCSTKKQLVQLRDYCIRIFLGEVSCSRCSRSVLCIPHCNKSELRKVLFLNDFGLLNGKCIAIKNAITTNIVWCHCLVAKSQQCYCYFYTLSESANITKTYCLKLIINIILNLFSYKLFPQKFST